MKTAIRGQQQSSFIIFKYTYYLIAAVIYKSPQSCIHSMDIEHQNLINHSPI